VLLAVLSNSATINTQARLVFEHLHNGYRFWIACIPDHEAIEMTIRISGFVGT